MSGNGKLPRDVGALRQNIVQLDRNFGQLSRTLMLMRLEMDKMNTKLTAFESVVNKEEFQSALQELTNKKNKQIQEAQKAQLAQQRTNVNNRNVKVIDN
jgi:hypothetical protein